MRGGVGRVDTGDRRTQLALGGAVLAGMALVAAYAIVGEHLVVVGFILLLLAAPFLIALSLRSPYLFPYCMYVLLVPFDNLLRIGPGGTLTKLMGLMSAVAIATVIVREKRIVRPPVTVYVAFGYALWTLASVFWAANVAAAIVDAQTMFSLVLMYFVLAAAPIAERDLRAICACIVLSGVAASAYAFVAFHGVVEPAEVGRVVVNVAGRTIDPNDFANSLLPSLALALVALVNAKSIRNALVMFVAVAVIAEGIIVSVSRGGVLGASVIAVIVVLFSRRRLIALAVALPSFIIVPLLVPSIATRWMTAFSTGGAGRTSIWAVDYAAWLQHPIIGWGAGAGTIAYDSNLLRVAPKLFYGWSRPPHNVPLHAMVDMGIVGLLLIVAAYLLTYKQLFGIRRDDPLHELRVGLLAAFAALGVVSLFIDMSLAKYLWIIIAAIAQLRSVVMMRDYPAAPAIVYEPPPPRAKPVYAARAASRT
jgi:O-antigen ligase